MYVVVSILFLSLVTLCWMLVKRLQTVEVELKSTKGELVVMKDLFSYMENANDRLRSRVVQNKKMPA